MPDQDIIERTLRQHWRSSYRLEKGGHPFELVAEALCKALAAVIRSEGGLVGFEDVFMASRKALTTPDGPRTLAEATRRLEQRFEQQESVKILSRTAQRGLALAEAGQGQLGRKALALQCLRTRIELEFFAKVRHRLVGPKKRFTDSAEESSFNAQIWAHLQPKLHKMATSLMADPSAVSLRAPRRSSHLPTTAELVDTPLVGDR